ncbi:pirin family protein [Dyadobacter subterraneus]|uniref:Pirin family protein n=1 Tax=Dyadobacter subterraneus TaxID=2773304 RepID=A0ABR9W7B8_9BACT|nr:pirin-like C-terminal cupin domain-containing protein [Dyadobacter subterraneus]MBE9461350.1 pirin family protein [Dyadobacter subterraneus]
MKTLQISSVLQTNNTGNNEFSARKVRGAFFNGLMDPLIGFDHFQLTNDVFGAHPHAGMSAISYLFDDSVPYHNLDSIGTDRVITPGSMMWTWAGSGVVHTEFPVPNGGRVHGLQLFVNIPAHNKQHPPQSLFLDRSAIPEILEEGLKVRVISGSTGNTANPIQTPDKLAFLHIFISAGKSFTHNLPKGWTGTIYTISGNVNFRNTVGQTKLSTGTVISVGLSDNNENLTFRAEENSEFILLSGVPLNEEIFSSGAMAMSSPGELGKAISDFEEGKMGFINMEGGKREVVLPV